MIFQQPHDGSDGDLLVVGQSLPPPLELVGVLDLL
jgi:hypothetical protein